MSIVGAFVAYQRVMLAEHKIMPQMEPVLQKMLERLPRYDTKVSYQYDAHMYHFVIENEIVYGCVSGAKYETRLVYAYLAQIKDSFKTKFAGGPDRYPRPSDLNQSNCSNFAVNLAAAAKTFNEDPQADKFGRIKEELTNTRQVMLENLDTVVVRGDNINNLCDRTELLREEAQGFHSNSRTLKHTLMCHHIKIIIGVILALAVIGLIIAFMVCGINFKKC